jgi:hypothetical protein
MAVTGHCPPRQVFAPFEEPMERRRLTAEQAGEIFAFVGRHSRQLLGGLRGRVGRFARPTGQALAGMHFAEKTSC